MTPGQQETSSKNEDLGISYGSARPTHLILSRYLSRASLGCNFAKYPGKNDLAAISDDNPRARISYGPISGFVCPSSVCLTTVVKGPERGL